MADLRNARTFTDSFIRGFSFVDDINKRRRDERKLDEELEARREERTFQREQATARGEREAARFERETKAEDRRISQESREREARGLVARGATAEELATFADTNAGFTRLSALRGEDEAVAAAQELNRLGAGQGLATQATAAVPGQPPAPVPGAPGGVDPVTGESQLAPSRGRDVLQSVERDELADFDPTAPEGFSPFERISRGVSEIGADISRGVGGLARGATNLVTQLAGQGRVVDTGDVGGALSDELLVPEAFTTEEEFAQMGDPADVERARQQNQQILAGLNAEGQDPEANIATRQIAESERLSGEAQQAEAAAVFRYQDVADPTSESQFRQMIAEDPAAASVQYFKDRGTLQSADPLLAQTMDRLMQPALADYTNQIQSEVVAAPLGSPEQRRQATRLANVQATTGQIYNDYRPAQAAGVDQRGMPVGNQQLSTAVMQEVNSPDRPRPSTPLPSSQINSAVTTVNRIKPNSRLNDTQIRALIRAKDAGLMTSADVQTVLLTGKLPSSSAAVKLTSHDPEDDLWATDANGNMSLVRAGRATPGKRKGGKAAVSPNQLDQNTLDSFDTGLAMVYPDATPEQAAAQRSLYLDNREYFDSRFDLRNQDSSIRLGRALAQGIYLNAQEDFRKENDWIPFNEFLSTPTAAEIIQSPEIRAELAGDFDIQMQAIPEVRSTGIPPGTDIAGLRSALQSGDFGPAGALVANNGSDTDVFEFAIRYDAQGAE